MKNRIILEQMAKDIGLDVPYYKGRVRAVNRCWHFSTDGNAVDIMFYDEEDFQAGMNRIFIVLETYDIVVLAFSLMDTHVHFILYGDFDACSRFVHDYVKRTSRHISIRHGDRNKLDGVPVSWQKIDTEDYLKTVICYTVKNAPAGGKAFLSGDYPWSSGPLYFRSQGYWCSPSWIDSVGSAREISELGTRERRRVLRARDTGWKTARIIDGIVFPGEYVAYREVERLFRTHKAYNYFLCRSKEDEVESRGGSISLLSIPMQEMKQHKNEACQELFGHRNSNRLNTQQRLLLVKVLRSRYNSSLKQIVRLCGLVFDEVKNLL